MPINVIAHITESSRSFGYTICWGRTLWFGPHQSGWKSKTLVRWIINRWCFSSQSPIIIKNCALESHTQQGKWTWTQRCRLIHGKINGDFYLRRWWQWWMRETEQGPWKKPWNADAGQEHDFRYRTSSPTRVLKPEPCSLNICPSDGGEEDKTGTRWRPISAGDHDTVGASPAPRSIFSQRRDELSECCFQRQTRGVQSHYWCKSLFIFPGEAEGFGEVVKGHSEVVDTQPKKPFRNSWGHHTKNSSANKRYRFFSADHTCCHPVVLF